MPRPQKIPSPPSLPSSFLSGPAPSTLTVKSIDFAAARIPEYASHYAIVIDDTLTPAECTTLIDAAETYTSGTWTRAMVNIGNGFEVPREQTRKCGRVIWDSQDLASKIWARVEGLKEVREVGRIEGKAGMTGWGPVMRKETWCVTRPNERLRFLKYEGGEYFRPHEDGCYETDDRRERSLLTLHLYLNGNEEKEKEKETGREDDEQVLVGGATTFHDDCEERRLDVFPKPGRILLFQQRGLLHSGDDVLSGVKYTMRTDIMYAKE